MAVNEQIVTGRKFRKLIDEATKLWQRISFWTKASDVEFDDGTTAETKVGAINGVTDSLTSTSSNIAASAAAVKALNDKVTELSSNLFKTKNVKLGVDQSVEWSVFTKTITLTDAITLINVGIYDTQLYAHGSATALAIRNYSFDKNTKVLTITFYGYFVANASNNCVVTITYI